MLKTIAQRAIFFFLNIILFTAFSLNGEAQDQQSFPFDQQCLKYDKANFRVGGALLDIMKTGDFPQYCVLYSLSNYQVKQKRDDGFFIVGPKNDETTVFLKSKKQYQQNQALPTGQNAFFVGQERFVMENGVEKEFYVFQEIDI